MGFAPIDSIERVEGRFKVYDLTCPPVSAFFANGIISSNCHFCAYRMSGYTSNQLFVGDSEAAAYGHNNPKRWIPTERALALIDEFKAAGVLSVQFTGGGEPTVHPDHMAIFQKALDNELRCSLVSNGLRWDYTLAKDILPRFDWVRVSVDAGSANYYAKARNTPRSNWQRVWENVRLLAASIKASKSGTVLGLGFVVTPESYRQIPEFVAIASTSGADNIRLTALFSTDNETPFLGLYDDIKRLIVEVRASHERDDFKVYDNFGSRFDDLKQHAPDYSFCSYQHYTAYVGGDLKAYRCCVLAYNKRGLVTGGDLKERRFDDFWKSQERKDDMNALDAHGCERCQFNSKNRALLYVMGNTASDTAPRHIEWP